MSDAKRQPTRTDEADMRDHPCNAAALWQLSHRTKKTAQDGSLVIEDKRKPRLDIDGTCICLDEDADLRAAQMSERRQLRGMPYDDHHDSD